MRDMLYIEIVNIFNAFLKFTLIHKTHATTKQYYTMISLVKSYSMCTFVFGIVNIVLVHYNYYNKIMIMSYI